MPPSWLTTRSPPSFLPCLSVCLLPCLSPCLPTLHSCLPGCPFACLSSFLSHSPTTSLPHCLFACPPPSSCLLVHVTSTSLHVRLSACLSASPPTRIFTLLLHRSYISILQYPSHFTRPPTILSLSRQSHVLVLVVWFRFHKLYPRLSVCRYFLSYLPTFFSPHIHCIYSSLSLFLYTLTITYVQVLCKYLSPNTLYMIPT